MYQEQEFKANFNIIKGKEILDIALKYRTT